jgi:exportin-1
MDLLNVYKVYSERISVTIAQQGAGATQLSLVRTMRSAKKEVLRLLITFIESSGPPESDPQALAEGFIPPVLDPILGDYQRNIPNARDPEVLTLFTTVIEKLKGQILAQVPRIMEAVFECTLQMITTNFEDFPEHRIRFFEFIKVSQLNPILLCCHLSLIHVSLCSVLGNQLALLPSPFQHSSITSEACS